MNPDRERGLLATSRRNPFWVCLLVFLAFAIDGGARMIRQMEQRRELYRMQLTQAGNAGRLSSVLAQAPQVEAKLQNISLDLIQVARTNALAAQLVREFNIQWTPGTETAAPAAVVPANLAVASPAATRLASTNHLTK